jgi:DNA-binding transcriptional LysR family regulator
MDIRQLKYFIAVAEELNFTRAAGRLHISQPPLTRQIQALEEDLGVALFVRLPRGVELTPAGQTLLNDAHHIRSLMDQSTERAQLAGKGQFGSLDIGVSGSATLDVVPRLLASYSASHPQVKLMLHPGPTSAQVIALRQGRVSVVFERRLPEDPDIAAELVCREAVLLLMPENHPLAKLSIVDINKLRGEPMIQPAAPPSQLTHISLKLCQAHGFEPLVSQRCADIMTGAVLSACGKGVMLVPTSMAVLNMPGLVCRPIKSRTKAEFTLHCFYLRGNRSPTLESLLKTVRKFPKE